ncbi:MAG: hypothetical protein WBL61_02685 [Bryobacteraceae bacterium]
MSPLRALAGHDALPGIRVVPVVRGRLAFAQVALEALEAEHPDALAVDLPSFLNGSEWLDTALSRLPLTTSVVIKQAGESLLLPFTPSDACSMAAWEARRRRLPFECVDGFGRLANQKLRDWGPDSGLSDDSVPPENIEGYFTEAWMAMDSAWLGRWRGRAAMARAGEIVHNLKKLAAERGRVLFIADYRSWWSVRKLLGYTVGIAVSKLRNDAPGALIFEDALALWHAGLMEMPRLVLEFFRSAEAGRPFAPDAAAESILGSYGELLKILPRAQWKSSAVLDAAEAFASNGAAAELAGRLLSYPAPTCVDAGDRIPGFGTVTSHGIEPGGSAFDPLDVFEAKPYYEPSSAEVQAFFPPEERANRSGWGPAPLPLVTRTEACRLATTHDNRWSTDMHSEHLALAAALVREHVGQLAVDPPLAAPPGLFTPMVFIWSSESDGDVRTVDEPNLTRRRMQFGELREGGRLPDGVPPPDCIHTLCATRSENTAWWGQMVQYDFTSSIATLYSGPETGPARYDAVTSHNAPYLVCRENPSSDPDLRGFERDQVVPAFAVKWARDLVIVAAHAEWQPSAALVEMARGRGVKVLVVPIGVIPETMTVRLRRRVFVAKTIRMNQDVGRRLENRFVNWRLHPQRA